MTNLIGTVLSTRFNLTRLIDKRFYSSEFELVLELNLAPSPNSSIQVKAIKCMRDWINNVLDQSIAFDIFTEMNTELFEDVDNNLILTPGTPHDYLLTMLLYSKLNAIGKGFVEVLHISLAANSSQGFSYHFFDGNEIILPSADDWLGKHRYFENCWWNREDGSTVEMLAEETDDINVKPDILIDLWADFVEDENREPAPIIDLNTSKLKIVNDDE